MGRKRKRIPGKNNTSLAIDEWSTSRRLNLFITIMAQNVVACADSMYTACRDARQKAKYGGGVEPPYPENDRWMHFYNNPEEPLITSYTLIFQEKSWLSLIAGDNDELQQLLEEQGFFLIENYGKNLDSDSFLYFWNRSQIAAQKIYRGHILQLQDIIRGKDDGTPEQIRAVKSSPEILFMLRVWVPCWLEYHIPFDELLTTARTGDIDAIEKVLRVDRMASFDPLIHNHFIRATRNGKKSWVDRYTAALKLDAEPLGVFSSQHIKYWLAGYIYEMAEMFAKRQEKLYRDLALRFKRGCKPKAKLSYLDILELFHKYSYDVCGRNDSDFRDINDKSFETRVRETRKFWRETLISAIAEADAAIADLQSEFSMQ